jgi:hypothetical protein
LTIPQTSAAPCQGTAIRCQPRLHIFVLFHENFWTREGQKSGQAIAGEPPWELRAREIGASMPAKNNARANACHRFPHSRGRRHTAWHGAANKQLPAPLPSRLSRTWTPATARQVLVISSAFMIYLFQNVVRRLIGRRRS